MAGRWSRADDGTKVTLVTRGTDHAQCLETTGLLAVGAMHDVNNVLTVITNYVDLALESSGDSLDAGERLGRLRADLEHIHQAARRGSSLTRRLLTYASGQGDGQQETCVNRVLEETLDLLKGPMWREITFVRDLDPGCWMARVDPVRLGQIVLNLVLNARDAMADGGALTVRTRNVGGPGDLDQTSRWVQLEISDTGCGIAAEDGAHLFEPFYTTKPPGSGTGLGLALVQQYVTKAGGSIRFESSLGAGTRFELRFLPSDD